MALDADSPLSAWGAGTQRRGGRRSRPQGSPRRTISWLLPLSRGRSAQSRSCAPRSLNFSASPLCSPFDRVKAVCPTARRCCRPRQAQDAALPCPHLCLATTSSRQKKYTRGGRPWQGFTLIEPLLNRSPPSADGQDGGEIRKHQPGREWMVLRHGSRRGAGARCSRERLHPALSASPPSPAVQAGGWVDHGPLPPFLGITDR